LKRRMLPIILLILLALVVLAAFSLWRVRSGSGAREAQEQLPPRGGGSAGTAAPTAAIETSTPAGTAGMSATTSAPACT
jgi:uncharacterized RDD family membrane protein YckC